MALGLVPGYFSDSGQDMVLDQHVFEGRRNGTFVEIGGNDGCIGSTSLFFEMCRNWSGLLIEANATQLAKAAAFRRCKCLHAVVAPTQTTATFINLGSEDTHQFGSGIKDFIPQVTTTDPRFATTPQYETEVQTQMLQDILKTEGICEIDYLSMDIEGVEYDILRTFPFEQFQVNAISVENHTKTEDMKVLLARKGFELVEYLGFDELYVHKTLLHDDD